MTIASSLGTDAGPAVDLILRLKTGGTILIARMTRIRVALILAVGGFAAKGAAVLVYRLLHPPVLLRVLTTYDPQIGRASCRERVCLYV